MTRRCVADDQYGKLTRRLDELKRRADEGTIPFEPTMNALTPIIEGKAAPFGGGLRGRFIRTMPIKIGGVAKDDLIEQVKAVRELSTYAESMMRHKLFITLDEPETAILIDLTPADLGFTENPTTTELLDVKRLADWSAANLEGYVLELCPAEVGPHLAIQYKDQPNGEILWVAMERIPDSDGNPYVFDVKRYDDGELWLRRAWTRPDYRWELAYRIVFRLRKVSSASVV